MLRVIWSLQLFSSFYIFYFFFFLPQTLTLPHAKSQCSWPRPKWSPRMETSLKSRRWAPSGTMSWCSLWGWSLWSTPKDWTTGWSRLDTWAVFEYCYNASFLLSFWDVHVITADRTWLTRCKQWFITIKSPVTWTITSNKEEKKDVALNYLNRSVHLFLIFLLRLIFFYFTVCFFFSVLRSWIIAFSLLCHKCGFLYSHTLTIHINFDCTLTGSCGEGGGQTSVYPEGGKGQPWVEALDRRRQTVPGGLTLFT